MIENIPDFSFEMKYECESNVIPFVKSLTPSDVYKIYKKGKKMRIDFTLAAY